MEQEKFNMLKPGDIIRHVTTGNSYTVVTGCKDGKVLCNRTLEIDHADEWERVIVPKEFSNTRILNATIIKTNAVDKIFLHTDLPSAVPPNSQMTFKCDTLAGDGERYLLKHFGIKPSRVFSNKA